MQSQLACMQESRLSCHACACLWVSLCSFTVDWNIIHYTAGQLKSLKATQCCERAKTLCHGQTLTWTALQSAALSAAVLERYIPSSNQSSHFKINGKGPNGRPRHLTNVTVWLGLKFCQILSMVPDLYNHFIISLNPLYIKVLVQLSCCHIAKGNTANTGKEMKSENRERKVTGLLQSRGL